MSKPTGLMFALQGPPTTTSTEIIMAMMMVMRAVMMMMSVNRCRADERISEVAVTTTIELAGDKEDIERSVLRPGRLKLQDRKMQDWKMTDIVLKDS